MVAFRCSSPPVAIASAHRASRKTRDGSCQGLSVLTFAISNPLSELVSEKEVARNAAYHCTHEDSERPGRRTPPSGWGVGIRLVNPPPPCWPALLRDALLDPAGRPEPLNSTERTLCATVNSRSTRTCRDYPTSRAYDRLLAMQNSFPTRSEASTCIHLGDNGRAHVPSRVRTVDR